jgi:hypothetical protein
MNWRMKVKEWRLALADFISGGELTFHREGWNRCIALHVETAGRWHDAQAELEKAHSSSRFVTDMALKSYDLYDAKISVLHVALKEIAACETPGANATVKRMARIAREALK